MTVARAGNQMKNQIPDENFSATRAQRLIAQIDPAVWRTKTHLAWIEVIGVCAIQLKQIEEKIQKNNKIIEGMANTQKK
jgi:hypothetical protein